MKNKTLNYYNENSKEYFETTKSVDMTHLYKEFLENIPSGGTILDLGCGSGRDSLYFKNHVYNVTAVDGSEKLAALASELIDQEVIVGRFEDLTLDIKFDGIWACASLLHLNENEIEKLLIKLKEALVYNGVLYMSFKYGDNEFVDEKNRYFNCYTEETVNEVIDKVLGLKAKRIYKTIDVIPGRENIIWLNVLCIKKMMRI